MSPLAKSLLQAGAKLVEVVAEKVAEGADDDELRRVAAEQSVILANHSAALVVAEEIVPNFRAR